MQNDTVKYELNNDSLNFNKIADKIDIFTLKKKKKKTVNKESTTQTRRAKERDFQLLDQASSHYRFEIGESVDFSGAIFHFLFLSGTKHCIRKGE